MAITEKSLELKLEKEQGSLRTEFDAASFVQHCPFALSFDFKCTKNKVKVLELCDGMASSYSGFSKAYPGKDLKVMIIEELRKYYKTIFLVTNNHRHRDYCNNISIITHYSALEDENVQLHDVDTLITLLKDSPSEKYTKENALIISLNFGQNLTLIQICLTLRKEIPVLSASDLLQASVDDKLFFYELCQKIDPNKRLIPRTLLVTPETDISSSLDLFPGNHVIFKPSGCSEGEGVCVVPKKIITEVMSYLAGKGDLSKEVDEDYYKFFTLKKEVHKDEHTKGCFVMQELVNSDPLEDPRYKDFDYTGRATYVVIPRVVENGFRYEIKLLGVYCKLPNQPRTSKDNLTAENMISHVGEYGTKPQPVSLHMMKIVDAQLQEFLQELVQITQYTTAREYMESMSKSNIDSYSVKGCNEITHFRYSSIDVQFLSGRNPLTRVQRDILINHFLRNMIQFRHVSEQYSNINLIDLISMVRAFYILSVDRKYKKILTEWIHCFSKNKIDSDFTDPKNIPLFEVIKEVLFACENPDMNLEIKIKAFIDYVLSHKERINRTYVDVKPYVIDTPEPIETPFKPEHPHPLPVVQPNIIFSTPKPRVNISICQLLYHRYKSLVSKSHVKLLDCRKQNNISDPHNMDNEDASGMHIPAYRS